MIKKLTPNELDILGTLEQLAQVSQEYGLDVNFEQLPESKTLKQQLLLEYLSESVAELGLENTDPSLQNLVTQFSSKQEQEEEVASRFLATELEPAALFTRQLDLSQQAYQSYKSWLVYDQLWQKFNSLVDGAAQVLLIRQYKSLFPQSLQLLQEQHALYHLAKQQAGEFLLPEKVFLAKPDNSKVFFADSVSSLSIADCINRSRLATYQIQTQWSELNLSKSQQEVFYKPYFAYYPNLNRRILFGEVEIDEEAKTSRYIPGILLLPNLTLVLTSEQLQQDPGLLTDLCQALEQQYFSEAQAYCRNPKQAPRLYQQYPCTAKVIILAGLQAFQQLDYELGTLAANHKVLYVSNQYWDDTSFLRIANEHQRNFYLYSYQQDFLASRYVFSDLKEVEMEQLLYQNLDGFERMFKQLHSDSPENFKKITDYLFLPEVSYYRFNPFTSRVTDELARRQGVSQGYQQLAPLCEKISLQTDYLVTSLVPSDNYNLQKAFVVSTDNKANLADSLSSETAQELQTVVNLLQQPFAESSEKLNSYFSQLGYLYTNFWGILLDPLVLNQIFFLLAQQQLKTLTTEVKAAEFEQNLSEDFEEFFEQVGLVLPTPELLANKAVAKDLSWPGLKLLNPAAVYEHTKLGLPILRDRIALLDEYLETAQEESQARFSAELAANLSTSEQLSPAQLALVETIDPTTRAFLQNLVFPHTKLEAGTELGYLTELYLHLYKLASNTEFFAQLAKNLTESLVAASTFKLELSGDRLQRLFQENTIVEQIFEQVEEMIIGYLNLVIKQHYLANLTIISQAIKYSGESFKVENLLTNLDLFVSREEESEPTELNLRPVSELDELVHEDSFYDLSLHNLLIVEQFKLSENNYRIYWYGSLVQELISQAKGDPERLQQIIEQRRLDHSISYQENLELLKQNFYYLDTSYRKIGQVNGLAVMENPDPNKEDQGTVFRISTITHPEDGHYADVDGELDLAGKFAMRANLISKSYLNSLFSEPLDFQGTIVTEQLYEETDGDSASLASFVVLASSLSEIPIKQSLAITGSMSQFGEAQAVGGVNQKIKAFFDVCNALDGMTGLQGVIIPQVNEQTIQLAPDILEQIRLGNFAIYSVEQALEAWEIISDVRGLDEKNEKEIYSLTPFTNDKEKDKSKVKAEDKEATSEVPTLVAAVPSATFIRPQANFTDFSWRQAYPQKQSLVEVLQKKFHKDEDKGSSLVENVRLTLRWSIMLLLIVILLVYIFIGIKLVLPQL